MEAMARPAPQPRSTQRVVAPAYRTRTHAMLGAPCCAISNKRSPTLTVVSCRKQDSRPHSTHRSVSGLVQRQSNVGVVLLSLGFCIGPLLDGIHSNVQLIIYENGALNVGPLQTSLVVPPLLGIFYGVVGLSQLVLDKWFSPKDCLQKTSLKRLFFSFIFLIMILELSAEMYKAGTPYNIEAYVLFALAELNWYLFDGTWWGFGLASVVGVLCPLSEIPFMKFYDLWHYPKANVTVFDEGLVTWVLACYFAYVPFLANLSRWLTLQLETPSSESDSD